METGGGAGAETQKQREEVKSAGKGRRPQGQRERVTSKLQEELRKMQFGELRLKENVKAQSRAQRDPVTRQQGGSKGPGVPQGCSRL